MGDVDDAHATMECPTRPSSGQPCYYVPPQYIFTGESPKPGDNYREALLQVVEKKIAGEEIEVIPEPEQSKVVDLMEALKASVEATKTTKPAAPSKRAAASGARRKKAAAG